MPWPLDTRVTLQEGKNSAAKPYQVNRLVPAIDKLKTISAREDEPGSPG
jgi:hypothetical protein